LSVLDLTAVARELKELIVGARLDNVYRAENGLLFKLSTARTREYLVANRHRVSTTRYVYSKTHDGLAALRSLVKGKIVTEVLMPRFDRILVVGLSNSTSIVFELLEPFNVVVVKDGSIKWLLHSYRGKDRALSVGAKYVMPPANFINPLEAKPDDLPRATGGELVKSLAKSLGLGKEVAAEVVARARGADPTSLLEAIRELVEEVRTGRLSPYICYSNDTPITVLPVKFVSVECSKVEEFERFCDAVDEYFRRIELEEIAELKSREVEAEVKRLEHSIEELEGKIAEYKGRASRLRVLATSLLNRRDEVEEVLGIVRRIFEEYRGRAAEHVVGLKRGDVVVLSFDPATRRVEVEVGGERISLGLFESVGAVVKRLFEDAKEFERKASKAEEVRNGLRKKIEELRRRGAEIKVETRPKEVRAREWFEKFHWFITSGGVPVIGGRDSSQNESVVKRYLKPHYLFFHADIPGASAVISKPLEGEGDVREVAQFAASFSRAWRLGLHSIDVYYVKGDQVSKEAPAGQYLAKGSFMVYGPRNWVRGVRLELGVGVREDDGVERVVAAPRPAIGKLAERYVVLIPGSMERGRVAKEVRKLLNAGVEVDEIAGEIPGPSNIVEVCEGSPRPWSEVKGTFSEW